MESERILGQNHILRHFENAIRMGKISHAYIINGEEGSGKMNLAIHFAKALQCERNNSNKAINEDGERIWGMKETSEVIMHSMAYDICEANGWDVGGVVHSHSKILTAFSMACMDVETEALPEMMGNFHKIPCVPYGAPGTKYILTMAEPYLADGYRIVLLGNHGSLAVGKTVEDAMNVVEACESIAEQVLITKYILKSEAPLDRDEVARFFDIYKENREKRKK